MTISVASATELLRRGVAALCVVPAAAVEELRKVTLWFSPEYPGVKPKAEYHPGAGWLPWPLTTKSFES